METCKSTPAEIRARFEGLVDVFSDLDRGQPTAVDSKITLELISEAAAVVNRGARDVLDLGCGAGNYSLKLLGKLPDANVMLVDLSGGMLERAKARVGAATRGRVEALEGDLRVLDLGVERFDVVVTGATLHHLRGDEQWDAVFAKVYRALRVGGSFWVVDLVVHEHPAVQRMMWARYGRFLADYRGEEFRDKVFGYIEEEDSPRSVVWQIERMKQAGFGCVELLHANSCFAAFGGIREK